MDRTEQEVRAYVGDLKRLYQDMLVAGGIFVVALIAWMATGGGFWPLWILLAFGAQAVVRLIGMGVIQPSKCCEGAGKWTAFLSPDWQERKVRELMKAASHTKDDSHEVQPSSKHNKQTGSKRGGHSKTPPQGR